MKLLIQKSGGARGWYVFLQGLFIQKSDMRDINFQQIPKHFQFAFRKHVEGVRFAIKHRIWEGFFSYGWLSRIMIFLAIILGLQFITTFFQWLNRQDAADPVTALSSVGTLFLEIWDGFGFLFAGGIKYVFIVLAEIIIFHVSRKALQIVTGVPSDSSWSAFVSAQKRMITVAFRSWILELILTALIGIAFGILPFFGLAETVLVFAVQCYFLGFTIMDNYFEQFHLPVKESEALARQYAGVALATGLVLQALMIIPVIGSLAGPALAAVAVTLTLYKLTDLHHRREEPTLIAG